MMYVIEAIRTAPDWLRIDWYGPRMSIPTWFGVFMFVFTAITGILSGINLWLDFVAN